MSAESGGNDKVDKKGVIQAFRELVEASKGGTSLPGVLDGPNPPHAKLPEDGFVDGMVAEKLLRHLLGSNPTPQEITELGPFIPHPNPENVYKLSDKTHVVAFPERLVVLFAAMSQERIDSLSMVMDLAPELILTLRQMARREIERSIRRRVWKRAWVLAGAVGFLAFQIAHFGVENFSWIAKLFPPIKGVLPWLSG